MAARRVLVVGALLLAGAAVHGCHRGRSAEPLSIRLVDLYKPEMVEGRQAASAAPARFEWTFADGDAHGWQAGIGVSGLAVKDGRLVGRSTTAVPLLAVEIPNLPAADVVHELQVKMRVSDGTHVDALLRGADPVDFAFEADLLPILPLGMTAPLQPGPDAQAYALRSPGSTITHGRRRLLIRPTDRAGADFAIESIRLVTRSEHLASVPSGIGWHGQSEIYRESLVGRAPETMRFTLTLPSRPRLELALGTIDAWPVRFRVAVSAGGAEETLAERTVTTPDRWEPLAIDLARFASREVTLTFGLSSERPGALGVWGAPVIRNRVAGEKGPGPVQGVILVWADTLRRDHLDVYGYGRPTAPTVRALAEQGTRFSDCIAQATWTKVSGPSIFTSLYPTTHGVSGIPDRLPASATTLTEVFRQAGWTTMGLGSVPFMGRLSNLHQGFEEFHEGLSIPSRETGNTKTARTQVDRLLPWLDAHRDVPFFVLLHVMDPHGPFRPEPPYDTMWADASRREEHEQQIKKVRPFIANPNLRRMGAVARDELVKAGIDPEAFVAYDRDWYDGSIRAMDTELGRVRERLASLGLDQRVVVAFLADHGDEFEEHGHEFHGQSVYGELTNVPLVFWGPGHVGPGRVVDGSVQLIDVMPTLIEVAGLKPPAGMQGRSLAAALAAGGPSSLPPRPAISEKFARSGAVNADEIAATAVFSGDWKLIENQSPHPGKPPYELFDHRQDPLDSKNVADQHPDVVQRLAKELAAWRAMATAARLKPDGAGAAAMSPEELERLRALGYVQ